MISLIQPVAAGNALRVFLDPPPGAVWWKLLRKTSDTFSGASDPSALVVTEGSDKVGVDIAYLVNGTLYYYRPYYRFEGSSEWVAGATVTGTPNATYQGVGGDVLMMVRERLDLGLQEEVRRGSLVHDQGHIKVLTAPPLMSETVWPLVTVQMSSEAPAERGLGEIVGIDELDDEAWSETEGWLARTQLTIMGWSTNPDERIEMRRALRRIVQANLPVFDSEGMIEIQFSQQDTEELSFEPPIYQVLCTFSCVSPVLVEAGVAALKDVQLQTIVG